MCKRRLIKKDIELRRATEAAVSAHDAARRAEEARQAADAAMELRKKEEDSAAAAQVRVELMLREAESEKELMTLKMQAAAQAVEEATRKQEIESNKAMEAALLAQDAVTQAEKACQAAEAAKELRSKEEESAAAIQLKAQKISQEAESEKGFGGTEDG